MNKSMYLFATALVAGTLGMTSCSNEEIAGGEGVENKVTLTMSVANRATRATADEVNMGSTMQKISNIAVVPMIGDAYLNPIIMGNIESPSTGAESRTLTKTTALNSKINRFKVYGNIDVVDGPATTKAFDENKTFTGFNISVANEQTLGTSKTVYNPHGLYYYGYAGVAGNQITTSANADGTSSSPLTAGDPIGNAKYVKVSKVDYAVGVLATAVFNADGSTKYIDNSGDGVADATVSGTYVDFKGIIIDKQSKTLDQDFKQVGGDDKALVSIYDTKLNKTLSDGKGFDGETFQAGENIGTSNKDKANIYTIVAATGEPTDGQEGEIVTGNLVFTLKSGNKLVLKDGTKIDASTGDKDFYLAFTLKPDETNHKAVFMKDYSTFFNAKVKNWGLASDKPIEVTDVNLAVEVNIDWKEGIIYEVEI